RGGRGRARDHRRVLGAETGQRLEQADEVHPPLVEAVERERLRGLAALVIDAGLHAELRAHGRPLARVAVEPWSGVLPGRARRAAVGGQERLLDRSGDLLVPVGGDRLTLALAGGDLLGALAGRSVLLALIGQVPAAGQRGPERERTGDREPASTAAGRIALQRVEQLVHRRPAITGLEREATLEHLA